MEILVHCAYVWVCMHSMYVPVWTRTCLKKNKSSAIFQSTIRFCNCPGRKWRKSYPTEPERKSRIQFSKLKSDQQTWARAMPRVSIFPESTRILVLFLNWKLMSTIEKNTLHLYVIGQIELRWPFWRKENNKLSKEWMWQSRLIGTKLKDFVIFKEK